MIYTPIAFLVDTKLRRGLMNKDKPTVDALLIWLILPSIILLVCAIIRLPLAILSRLLAKVIITYGREYDGQICDVVRKERGLSQLILSRDDTIHLKVKYTDCDGVINRYVTPAIHDKCGFTPSDERCRVYVLGKLKYVTGWNLKRDKEYNHEYKRAVKRRADEIYDDYQSMLELYAGDEDKAFEAVKNMSDRGKYKPENFYDDEIEKS